MSHCSSVLGDYQASGRSFCNHLCLQIPEENLIYAQYSSEFFVVSLLSSHPYNFFFHFSFPSPPKNPEEFRTMLLCPTGSLFHFISSAEEDLECFVALKCSLFPPLPLFVKNLEL